MQDKIFDELTQQYLEKGISVIPVKGKVPQIENWQRWCSELPDDPITYLGQTGIGVCLGPASNLVAVDIDTDDENILNKVPPSPVVRKGKKGEVRFFQYSKNIQSRTYRDWNIEILSIGRQAVLPPSIHPETKKPYVWVKEDLLNFDLDNLPILDLNFLNSFGDIKLSPQTVGGRQNKLKDIVVAMLTRNEPIEAAAKEVYEYDRDFHEVRWFTDPTDQYRAKNEAEAQSAAYQFVLGIAQTLTRSKVTQPILNFQALMGTENVKDSFKKFELKSYPEPEGLLKEFCELIIESSYTDVPNMALGSAISIFSILLGNSYAFEDVKSNIFCLLLADSGTGKKFGINVARSLLGDHNLLGSADYLSSSAISSTLSDFCIRLDVSDEFSKTLKLSVDGNAFQAAMLQDLCRLWSASTDGFDLPVLRKLDKDKEENSPSRVSAPFISILTATTLYEFKDSAKRNAFTSGFIPRFLIFMDKVSDTIKTRLDYLKIEEKKKICADIVKRFLMSKRQIGLLKVPFVNNYSLDKKASAYFDGKMVEYYNKSKNEENESMKAMMNRSREYFKKLALIHSVSRMGGEIEERDLVWASEVVEISLYNVQQFVAEASAENKQQAEKERVLGLIMTNPGIAQNKLTDKTRFLNGIARKAIIQDLIHEERIMYRDDKCPKNGKITKVFFPISAR